MRGTRYGDFSRLVPAHGYSGVLMQQGRVQLDADVNEQSARAAATLRRAVSDLFGGSAAPAMAPGFGLRPRLALEFDGSRRLVLDERSALADGPFAEHTLELWVTWERRAGVLAGGYDWGAERTYEIAITGDGRLTLELGDRSHTATEPLPAGVPVHLALVFAPTFAGLFADGRQVVRDGEHRGRVDAPFVVLGRPPDGDRDGWHGLMSGVRAWDIVRSAAELAVATEPLLLDAPGLLAVWWFEAGGDELSDAAGARVLRLDGDGVPRWRLMDLIVEPGRFYVDGVLCEHPRETLYSRQPGAREPLPSTPGEYVAYLEAWEESVSALAAPALREVALGVLDTTVRTRIATRVRIAAAGTPIDRPASARLLAEHAGEHAPGNHLYRVEIHRDAPDVTFKWSRDNGSSLFAVAVGEHGGRVLDALPAVGGVEPLAPGDIVEPLGPRAALDDPPRRLLRVHDVSEHEGRVTLDAAPAPDTAFLRRWDHDASGDAEPWTARPAGAELPVRPGWIDLEDGIRIRFAGEDLRRGDYWWIVSRLDLRSIEWPREHGHPVALPPAGVERLTAPLATLTVADDDVVLEDARRIVRALVDAPPPAGDPPEPEPEPEPEPAPEPDPEPAPEPHWRFTATLELAGLELEHVISDGASIIAATAHELFTVVDGEVRRLAELPVVRHGFAVCVLEGLLLVCGGGQRPEHADGHVHGLDLHQGVWRRRDELPHHRTEVAVVAHRGHVHAIGGRRTALLRHGVAGTHHIYDPVRDEWRAARELPIHRAGAVAISAGRHVHVIGGHGDEPSVAHERYDAERDAWESAAPLPRAHALSGGCLHEDRPLVLHDRHALAYDADTDAWVDQPTLPQSLARPFVFAHAGHAHVLGTREDGRVALYALR